MPETLNALLTAFLATIPGGLYTWSFEAQAGRFGATATDRVQRFLGASAFFLALELWPIYEFYRRFVVTGTIQAGKPLPWGVWLVPVAFVVVPVVAGGLLGRAAFERKGWVRVFTGPSPAPRAWDYLFSVPELHGWLRLSLKDGGWVAGMWTRSPATELQSYAAGYPEAQDLFLSEVVETDDLGILLLDEHDQPIGTGRSLLIRWDEIAYAEFVEG